MFMISFLYNDIFREEKVLFAGSKKLSEKAIRLLITGTPDSSLEVDRLSALNIYKVILKPWDNESFRKVIADSLVLSSRRD